MVGFGLGVDVGEQFGCGVGGQEGFGLRVRLRLRMRTLLDFGAGFVA